MKIEEYFAQLEAWKAKYGAPTFRGRRNTNLTLAQSSCSRCGVARTKMSRHHIRNDYFFCLILPDRYVPRYLEFAEGDVEKLCEKCHNDIHGWWKPLVLECTAELLQMRKSSVIYTEKEVYEWCEMWKEKFYQSYKIWIRSYDRLKESERQKRKRKREKQKGISRLFTTDGDVIVKGATGDSDATQNGADTG